MSSGVGAVVALVKFGEMYKLLSFFCPQDLTVLSH
jgi:hypothetical protein